MHKILRFLFSFYLVTTLHCFEQNAQNLQQNALSDCPDNQSIYGCDCNTSTDESTCCIFTSKCGSSTNLNNTYYTNVGYPGSFSGNGICTYTVKPCSTTICQLRIDFRTLNLAQPDGNGSCITDVLTITGGSSEVPPICGENSGQHVYVNFDQQNSITIKVNVTTRSNVGRMWNMQLSQISCDSDFRAPDGCLQYHSESSGTISSFNYGAAANPNFNSFGVVGTRQIAGHRYGICIGATPHHCTITYSLPSVDRSYAFTLTGDAQLVDPALIGTGIMGKNGNYCTTDYIVIPDPLVNDTSLTGIEYTDRFCGLGMFPVTSQIMPFVLYVVWDENDETDVANRGFQLKYKQNKCK